MHTVRNRFASRPPMAVPPEATPKVPTRTAVRHEAACIKRGSMAMPLAAIESSGLVEPHQPRRRNPKGKKARKAATRLAEAREGETLVVPLPLPDVPALPRRARQSATNGNGSAKAKAKAKAKPAAKPRAAAAVRKAVLPEQLPAITAPPLLEQRLAAALPLPSRSEPLVAQVPAMPVRLLTFVPAPEPLVLPAEPEPEPLPVPEPATALVLAPLPRARALVPLRRQGLVDVIAFLLRDTGRRLARWSARRNKTREEQAALRRAEARQINLQRELEALDALRQAKG